MKKGTVGYISAGMKNLAKLQREKRNRQLLFIPMFADHKSLPRKNNMQGKQHLNAHYSLRAEDYFNL